MRHHKLGRTGLFVSELSLGTMTFGSSERFRMMGELDQDAANALVARAFEAGVNLFDTADVYADGDSERITGEALRNLKAPRESYVVATKAFGPVGPGPNDGGASRAHVLDGAKASLGRLGLDHIDLYQIHGFDPATPIEETLRALDDLVRGGHVRYVGVSNWAAWQIAKALGASERLGLARFDSLQAYYSVAGRDLEREIVPMLESEGVGLLVWSPLAGGFLSGKVSRDDAPPEGTRRAQLAMPPVDEARGYDAIDALRRVGDARGVSVARVALAWLLHQKTVTSVILGAKRLDQLDDNLAAADLALSDEDLKAIGDASRIPTEYPGWMFDLWSAARTKQLAESRR